MWLGPSRMQKHGETGVGGEAPPLQAADEGRGARGPPIHRGSYQKP